MLRFLAKGTATLFAFVGGLVLMPFRGAYKIFDKDGTNLFPRDNGIERPVFSGEAAQFNRPSIPGESFLSGLLKAIPRFLEGFITTPFWAADKASEAVDQFFHDRDQYTYFTRVGRNLGLLGGTNGTPDFSIRKESFSEKKTHHYGSIFAIPSVNVAEDCKDLFLHTSPKNTI